MSAGRIVRHDGRVPESDQVIGWIREIVLDTADPHRLAGFWAALLGGAPVQWYPGWVTPAPHPLTASAVFWTRPYPGIFFHSKGHPRIVNSKLS
jgi:Glyoxalase-like domain